MLLPVSRYDIALGKVENPLDDPEYPLGLRNLKDLFNWMIEDIKYKMEKPGRSRYMSTSGAMETLRMSMSTVTGRRTKHE